MIDVVGAWSEVTSLERGRQKEGVMADVKATAKWRSYEASLASQATGGRGWLCEGKSKATDVFVPFAFEIGGALGTEAKAFMREAVKVAEFCRKGQGDLQHWSAMSLTVTCGDLHECGAEIAISVGNPLHEPCAGVY